jgi:hypothetical protein
LKAAEVEVAGEEDDGKESESEERPPPIILAQKTRLQKKKEEEAAKGSPEEATSSEESSSDDVLEVTPSKVKWKQSPSHVDVKIKEELRTKRKHDRPTQVRIFRYLKPEVDKPAPVGHPVLRMLPVSK